MATKVRHRGCRGGQRFQTRTPHEINVPVDAVEPAGTQPVLDPAARYPGREQLLAVHQPPLQLRDPCDLPISESLNSLNRPNRDRDQRCGRLGLLYSPDPHNRPTSSRLWCFGQ